MFSVKRAVDRLKDICEEQNEADLSDTLSFCQLQAILLAGQDDSVENELGRHESRMDGIDERLAILEEIFSTHFPKQTLDITGKHLEKPTKTGECAFISRDAVYCAVSAGLEKYRETWSKENRGVRDCVTDTVLEAITTDMKKGK